VKISQMTLSIAYTQLLQHGNMGRQGRPATKRKLEETTSTRRRVGIVRASWHVEIISALVSGCRESLLAGGVAEEDIIEVTVPGSYELPFACKTLIESKTLDPPVDVVIAVGVLIKGSTMHFEYIAEAVSSGLMHTQLQSKIPIVFGVLTCLNEDQAYSRAGIARPGHEEDPHNHGTDWGSAALAMTELTHRHK